MPARMRVLNMSVVILCIGETPVLPLCAIRAALQESGIVTRASDGTVPIGTCPVFIHDNSFSPFTNE